MEPIIYALPHAEAVAERLGDTLGLPVGELATRRFPDGEPWMRVVDACQGRDAVVVADLNRPDTKVAALLFLAQTLGELGARRVGLVAPYLAYMRQDERFEAGEAVTSRCFARLVSRDYDWLATVDPHLHRLGSLGELYAIPTFAAKAAPLIAHWLAQQPIEPVLVGPDAESEQWVEQVASLMDCPYVTFEKTRHGDRDVELADTSLEACRGRRPVIVDDIISTGVTMAETIGKLRQAGLAQPVCVAIHGVFAKGAEQRLRQAGAAGVLTCNTIAHRTNAIDVAPALAEQVGVALRHSSADAAE